MDSKIIALAAIIAVSAILIASTAVNQDALAKCKKYRGHNSSNTQTLAQANACGNGSGSSHIKCQNLANQIQGNGNAANIIGIQ
jgi:hypothetical protein